MSKIIDTALEYIKKGFSIIPINPRTKKPIGEWKQYQEKQPDKKQVRCWWKNDKFGIGIVTGMFSNVVVVDNDCYKDPDDIKKGKQILDSLIPESLDIPTAQSPRGGEHLYFCCPDDKLRNDTDTIPNCDLRANGGFICAPPSIGYKWINPINGVLPGLPHAYIDYIHSHKKTPFIQKQDNSNIDFFEESRRDEDSFTITNTLIKSNLSNNFVKAALRKIKAAWNQKEFDENWIQSKIESACKRSEKIHDNLREEIQEYIVNTTGEFNINDIDRELGLMSKELKNNRRTILNQLIKKEVIEKIGKRTGNYRKIEKENREIVWQNASTEGAIDLKLPFNIDDLVYIFPGNIIVIGGEKDSGKSAFLLNVVHDNMGTHDIVYLCSEMGELELYNRFDRFENIKIEEWKVKVLDCGNNFQDYIVPTAINLIDFLEISDEFWKINGEIRKIYDKLTTGIAIIAIQKKKGSEYARGGEFSMEKARLYITLQAGDINTPSELKIISAKNPRGETPPRGKIIKYKLVQGCKFVPEPDDGFKTDHTRKLLIKNAKQYEEERQYKE